MPRLAAPAMWWPAAGSANEENHEGRTAVCYDSSKRPAWRMWFPEDTELGRLERLKPVAPHLSRPRPGTGSFWSMRPCLSKGRMVIMRASCLMILAAMIGLIPASPAPAAVLAVGVVDFYALRTFASFSGITPTRFAADDLSPMLASVSGGRFAVVESAAMEQAESQLGWQNGDVLRFERLRALARAVNADRLVVGWITLLAVSVGRSNNKLANGGNGPPTALSNLVFQVFDAGQGRIVSEMRESGFAMGASPHLLQEWALHRALCPRSSPWSPR